MVIVPVFSVNAWLLKGAKIFGEGGMNVRMEGKLKSAGKTKPNVMKSSRCEANLGQKEKERKSSLHIPEGKMRNVSEEI